MNILIIEDEPKIVSFLKKGLTENGYEVEVAYDGQLGIKLATSKKFDIILLDVIIPFINGYEVCRRVWEYDQRVAILMLTALGSTDGKIQGFETGADDYLVKPFDFKELLARIKSLVKRSKGELNFSSAQLRVADLILDLHKKNAKRGDKETEMTAKEYLLFELLMKKEGRVYLQR